MRVAELSWSAAGGWVDAPEGRADTNLVLFFGARQALADGDRYQELRAMFPNAHVLGCSTGGQIRNQDITDDEIAAAAIRFDATRLRIACEPACSAERSRACGQALGAALAAPDLVGIFVLSDGLSVNGSELVAGISAPSASTFRSPAGWLAMARISPRRWSARIALRASKWSPGSAFTVRRSA